MPQERRIVPILSARIAIHAWIICGSILMTLVFGIPKFEQVFKDFKIELPAITQITLVFSRLVANDWLWLPLAGLAIGLPFGLTALMAIGDPSRDDVKQREKWICRGLRAAALLVILWTALSLFLPYTALIQTMVNHSEK